MGISITYRLPIPIINLPIGIYILIVINKNGTYISGSVVYGLTAQSVMFEQKNNFGAYTYS